MPGLGLASAPALMHLSREDEHFIGGYRPAVQGRVKAGFDKDGKLLAVDMFVICENGPFEQQGDTGQTGRIASLVYLGDRMAGGARDAQVHRAATQARAITSSAVRSVPKRFGAGAGSAGRAAMGE